MRRPKRNYADELAEDLRIVRGLREALAGLAARHKDINALNVGPVLDVGIEQLADKQKAATEPGGGEVKLLRAADLFCGAGGASTGLVRACQALGIELELLAVNHWPIAVQTHSLNHPGVRHLCESVERIDPLEAIKGGRLHLLLAGPECTHFSTARGGRPVNPQSRASAWHILKWAQELYIDTILIENVPEFRTWGPIGSNHKPLKSRKGETYRAFLAALRSLGYAVEDRILNAADYGDPTTRQRLFILARRGRHTLRWPVPTHSKAGGRTLFGSTQRWKPAREIIDWTVPGKSIFDRKKPLRPATIARILAGLEKFGGQELKPFLVILRNNQAAQSIDGPVPTLTTSGANVGVCQPFLVPVNHGADELRSRSAEEPLPTLTGRANQYLVQPFVLQQQSGGAPRSTEDPAPTVATDGAISLVQPFLVPYNGSATEARVQSIDEPLRTQTTENRFGIAQPFLVPMYGEREGQAPRTHSVDDPVPVIPATGGGKFGVVDLVQPVIDGYVLDIHFRMLQPHELAAAMSFPKSYVFSGNREAVVKQIGNSWAGELSFQLSREIVADYAPAKRHSWRDEVTA